MPTSGKIGLAIMEGAGDVRVWRDPNRDGAVSFAASGSGPPLAECDAEDAPTVLWVEGVNPSPHARGVHLRLSSAGLVTVTGIDDAALTVVQLEIAFPGVPEDREDGGSPAIPLAGITRYHQPAAAKLGVDAASWYPSRP